LMGLTLEPAGISMGAVHDVMMMMF